MVVVRFTVWRRFKKVVEEFLYGRLTSPRIMMSTTKVNTRELELGSYKVAHATSYLFGQKCQ
jgi:hypothetical protein